MYYYHVVKNVDDPCAHGNLRTKGNSNYNWNFHVISFYGSQFFSFFYDLRSNEWHSCDNVMKSLCAPHVTNSSTSKSASFARMWVYFISGFLTNFIRIHCGSVEFHENAVILFKTIKVKRFKLTRCHYYLWKMCSTRSIHATLFNAVN